MQNQNREKVQEEAITEASKYTKRTLNISMRVGKTKIGLEVINKIVKGTEGKVLIVAPKLSIFKGWKDDIKKFNYHYLNEHIDYVTYRSFSKLKLSDYKIIVFDEIHALKMSHNTQELYTFKGEILGLTGTPPTNKHSEQYKMIKHYAPIQYTYHTEDAIDADILNDYRIIVHMIPLSQKRDIHVKTAKHDFYTNEIKAYEYATKSVEETRTSWANINRMKTMQNFKSKEVYAKNLLEKMEHKCIVFANTKDQADKLCDHTYHSSNSESEANLQLFKIGVIEKLGCVLQLSEGVTIPGLKESIILHAFASDNKFLQRFARALNLTTDDMSNIHLLCYKDTVDEQWIEKALSSLDQSKITYKEFKD